MILEQAQTIAGRIIRELSPYCQRIEIAGSVRRMKPEVKDIEIVATPKINGVADLFGVESTQESQLDAPALKLGRPVKNGAKYKKIALPDGINIDLFIVTPPAQFGVLHAIRTGPADFSHWLVTSERQGGAMPYFAKCKDGAIHSGESILEMPNEEDLFKFLRLPCLPPNKRKAPASFTGGLQINTFPKV